MQLADDSVFRVDLEKVEAQTGYLRTLVEDLLSFSSLRSAKMPLHVAAYDLCRLCREVCEGQALLTNRQIDLRLPPDPLILQGDQGRLSQVVTNLVTNAIKYSPPESVVRVEIYPGPTQALLSVHNDGSILSEEQQKAIFEPFYRTPEAQQSATPGWGLGLAISKEIVEQHQGRLWVESWEGKGTTFFVALPMQGVS
jgi:signal transduction histidine kinase